MLRAMSERQAIRMEYWSPVLSAWLEVNLYPSGEGLAVYFRDITQRKTMEAEILREALDIARAKKPTLLLPSWGAAGDGSR